MVPTQQIAITLTNGDLYIMAFVLRDERQGWERLATPDNVNKEIAKASENWPAKAQSWRYITISDLPTERDYREAWRDTGTTIDYDMSRARSICLNRLRAKRDARLNELDKEWMRATGQRGNSEAAQIENNRQILRDFPQTIQTTVNSAQTISELRAIQLPV